MIKDLNGLTVLMLVVTILSYDTVGGVPYCGSWHTIFFI